MTSDGRAEPVPPLCRSVSKSGADDWPSSEGEEDSVFAEKVGASFREAFKKYINCKHHLMLHITCRLSEIPEGELEEDDCVSTRRY